MATADRHPRPVDVLGVWTRKGLACEKTLLSGVGALKVTKIAQLPDPYVVGLVGRPPQR